MFMTANKILCVVMLATICTGAQAAEWHPVAYSNEGYLFLDSSSILSVSSTRIGWVKTVNSKSVSSVTSIRSTMVKYAAHCKTNNLQVMAWASYRENGSLISSGDIPGKSAEFIPESLGEYVYKAMCGPVSRFNAGNKIGDPVDFTDWYFENYANQQKPSQNP
jgi:hypothetical protein